MTNQFPQSADDSDRDNNSSRDNDDLERKLDQEANQNPEDETHLHDPEPPRDEIFFDPTHEDFLRTQDGHEIPQPDGIKYVSGTRHPSYHEISKYLGPPERGSIQLTATIPLINTDPADPQSRNALYGVDIVFNANQRSTHTMVLGVTGSGKNVRVIDPLRFSAIRDSAQTVVSFSLKASDYGAIQEACRRSRKPLHVVNINDAWRSIAWNPLETKDWNSAFDRIRRFADAVRNPLSSDSEFWTQWIKTGLTGAWQAGYRSFPAMFQLFSLPLADLIRELRSQDNPSSHQLASFLEGRSHNADTVLASIIGALAAFLSDSALRVMSRDELKLEKLFKKPVCLHIEMPETSLETQRILYQMLARSITDELINEAERRTDRRIEATIFYDDMPSLGFILSPERLLTMRSRGIGVVAGVQTISSLELAYQQSSRALIDNFANKIILPGGPASDAKFFSDASGEQLVSLPCLEGQTPTYLTRPLLTAAAIRTPDYYHNILEEPATLMLGAITFQAYLQRSFELRKVKPIIMKSKPVTGKERLRKRQIAKPTHESLSAPNNQLRGRRSRWSSARLAEELAKVKAKIGFGELDTAARVQWAEIERCYGGDLATLLQLTEQIRDRKANLYDFIHAARMTQSRNNEVIFAYLDFVLLRRKNDPTNPANQPEMNRPLISTTAMVGIGIRLMSFNNKKIEMVKVVKELTGMSLVDSKQIVEAAPSFLGRCVDKSTADKVLAQILAAGGTAVIS